MTEFWGANSRAERRTPWWLCGRDRYGEMLRIGLVPCFVLLCYQWEWRAWRALVRGAVVALLPWAGAPGFPLSATTFAFHGEGFRVEISCTALDLFFGSVPLLWQWRRPLWRNVQFFTSYFLCLFVINLARLEMGFILYAQGVPWVLSHEAMSGVFYFAAFLWISRRRGWFAPGRRGRAVIRSLS